MAWVLTVARRFALDRRRSLIRRSNALERMGRQITSGASRMSADPGWLHRVDLVSALDQLTRKDRELLESAYFEGLSAVRRSPVGMTSPSAR